MSPNHQVSSVNTHILHETPSCINYLFNWKWRPDLRFLRDATQREPFSKWNIFFCHFVYVAVVGSVTILWLVMCPGSWAKRISRWPCNLGVWGSNSGPLCLAKLRCSGHSTLSETFQSHNPYLSMMGELCSAGTAVIKSTVMCCQRIHWICSGGFTKNAWCATTSAPLKPQIQEATVCAENQ